MSGMQGLVEDHAERQGRQGGGDDQAAAQPDETTAAPALDSAASDGPPADAVAARGAAKAERRRQAQGKQSRRDALQTRVKVPVALGSAAMTQRCPLGMYFRIRAPDCRVSIAIIGLFETNMSVPEKVNHKVALNTESC